jgi:uncharacterized membrane protein YbaN (DUF454 family)
VTIEKFNRILTEYNEWLAGQQWQQQYIMQYLQREEGFFRKAKYKQELFEWLCCLKMLYFIQR